MPSVDLTPIDPSMESVFGKIPTRPERGEWAPMKTRRVIYQQRNHDYAPIEEVALSDGEILKFGSYGLFNVKSFMSAHGVPDTQDSENQYSKLRYFLFPIEPGYRVHEADNAMGFGKIAFNVQVNLISKKIFFPKEYIFKHPVVEQMWDEAFGDMD